MTIKACVFDAYSTLFDVAAAAREAATEPDYTDFAAHWPKVAENWRLKQLQYTWLRAITGAHTDFWQVTKDGLDWALEASSLHTNAKLRERLLALYWELSAYPEVPEVLTKLKTAGLTTAILSNGSPNMLQGAVRSAQLGAMLDYVLSVEEVGIFKPATAVYNLVSERLDCTKSEVLFVSSNGWDAAGATGHGFTSAWVNRSGEPIDRLPWKPQHILSDLQLIPTLVGTENVPSTR